MMTEKRFDWADSSRCSESARNLLIESSSRGSWASRSGEVLRTACRLSAADRSQLLEGLLNSMVRYKRKGQPQKMYRNVVMSRLIHMVKIA